MRYYFWLVRAIVCVAVFAVMFLQYPHAQEAPLLVRGGTALAFAGVALLTNRRNWFHVIVAYTGCLLGVVYFSMPLANGLFATQSSMLFRDAYFPASACASLMGGLLAITGLRLVKLVWRLGIGQSRVVPTTDARVVAP